MARVAFPDLAISIIKSNKISTIGVGEGSNEHWLEFSKIVGITTEDLIRETDATFKHGIKFINWRGKNDIYYHSIPEYLSCQHRFTGLPYNLLYLISEDIGAENLVWDKSVKGLIADPRNYDFAQFHFNTFKLNDFLEKLCIQRNIKIIEDTIVDCELDFQGYMKSLKGELNNYSSDFFIDTSGFQRLLSKKMQIKWHSYEQYLPTNSAIAFPSPMNQDSIETFTEARARNHGWSWRSPVQGRYGNGYVYSDKFADIETVIVEIQKDYSEPIQIAKEVKFVSGKLDKFWNKNVLSAGLSGSFIEPLEASNIGTTIMQAKAWMSAIVCWNKGDNIIESRYNHQFHDVAENTLSFVQLHYITDRRDTEFWRWCNNEMPLTDFNRQTLEIFKKNFVSYNHFHRNNYELFDELDWIQVMYGLGLFEISSLKKLYKQFPEIWKTSQRECNSIIDENTTDFFSHRELLNLIKK